MFLAILFALISILFSISIFKQSYFTLPIMFFITGFSFFGFEKIMFTYIKEISSYKNF